jgi:hypothetical protein
MSKREFSEEASEWLRNYWGSYDTTALLMAFDAGVKSAQKQDATN